MGAVPKDTEELHRIAITGIIWKEENGERRYLVTKRAPHKKTWPNKWTVPGGGLQVGDYIHTEATYQNSESPQWYNAVENALRREIKEEVNVEVSEVRYLLDVAFVRGDDAPCIVLSFYCKYASGDVALDEDSTDFAWITAAEAKDYDLIQGIDHEIQEVDKRLSH